MKYKIKSYLIERKKLKVIYLLSKIEYLLSCIQVSDNDNLYFWSDIVGDCIDIRNKIKETNSDVI